MLVPYLINPTAAGADQPPQTEQPSRRRKRRGVTSLEYCVMASLIIAVCVLAVQHIGALVAPSFGKASAGTKSGTTGS